VTEQPLINTADVGDADRNVVNVLDHGYVALVDTMGHDRTPATAARTSFRNRKAKTAEEDAKLTDYLIRNEHTTPVEFVQVLLYMKLPIFVARQLVRYRTQSINEVSYRYVKAAREFYVPAPERCQRQSTDNKQGSSSTIVEYPTSVIDTIKRAGDQAFDAYEDLLGQGLATELARTVLPVGTYTEWYTQWNLHNLFRMLRQRLDAHAQYEVRVYAQAVLKLITPVFPTLVEAWLKHTYDAKNLARPSYDHA